MSAMRCLSIKDDIFAWEDMRGFYGKDSFSLYQVDKLPFSLPIYAKTPCQFGNQLGVWGALALRERGGNSCAKVRQTVSGLASTTCASSRKVGKLLRNATASMAFESAPAEANMLGSCPIMRNKCVMRDSTLPVRKRDMSWLRMGCCNKASIIN